MVIKKGNRIVANSSAKSRKKYIKAAEEGPYADMDDADDIMDAVDDVADSIEDIQDSIDDIAEDEVQIAVNNNIADHYIAECDSCNGIFISAVVDSDQDIDFVSGVCPLCGKETEQHLKWVIKAAHEK